MRLCRVDVNGIGQLRLSRGSHFAQLPASCSRLSDAMRCWRDLQALDARGGLAWKVEEGLRRLAPIEEGSSVVFCVGKNYLSHVNEVDSSNAMKSIAKGQAPEVPIIFSKPTRCLSGAEDPIPYPHRASQELDYEGELVVVIGKTGKNIDEGDAWDHVFGFTIANDVSARDAQRMHQQWHVGKSMDGFCPMGPTIVPKEEIVGSDGTLDLDITTMVNGKVRQHGNAKDMIFSVPEIIATVSKGFTLQPGDVILTGTPAGVGAGMKPPVFLKPGDVVEVAIEGIGAIKNRVE